MKSFPQLLFVLIFSLILQTVNSKNYYSDPVNGSMNNTGSSDSPWASLSHIFLARKSFLAGDTIFLRTGNHGYAIITGTNSGFVVITPEPGQNPVLSRVRVSDPANGLAADYWKLYKLTVQSEATGKSAIPSYPLVDIWHLASNITVSSCLVTSNQSTDNWTRDDWRNRCNNGIYTRPKLNSNHIIENNMIKNTAFSLSISSSNTIIKGNTVQNFTNDANRILGSDILYENNKTFDLYKVMAYSENHDDLLQGFTNLNGGEGVDTLKNNIIRNSIFVTCTDSARNFRGSSQGIALFDGPFYNWTVENNIVLVDQWHGISLYGGINCKVINNTVLDPYPFTPSDPYDNNSTAMGPAWILVDQKTPSIASLNNVVKNNLVHRSVNITSMFMGLASNNIVVSTIDNFKIFFVNTTDLTYPAKFDLHLRKGSSAIDAGDNVFAPPFDYDGVARPQGSKVDVGAFEYTTSTAILNKHIDSSRIKIYPNPFRDELNIEFEKELPAGSRIQLFGLNGQEIYDNKTVASTKSMKIQDSSLMPLGILFFKITDSIGASYVTKLVRIN